MRPTAHLLRPPISGPRDGRPPMLTVDLDLCRITLHDLDRLAVQFVRILRQAWDARPDDELRRPSSSRPPARLVALETAEDAATRLPRRDKAEMLPVAVDMRGVTMHRLADLAAQFKAAVRRALARRPAGLRPSLRPPAQLAFLRRIGDATFVRYLWRYDLHIRFGLSFRLIAVQERANPEWRATTRPGSPGNSAGLPSSQNSPPFPARPQQVGMQVRGEDAVARSVHLIFEAIHRRPYDRRSARASYMKATRRPARFRCPTHPAGDCDEACRHLRQWYNRVKATLPSDSTGRPAGEVLTHTPEPPRPRRLGRPPAS